MKHGITVMAKMSKQKVKRNCIQIWDLGLFIVWTRTKNIYEVQPRDEFWFRQKKVANIILCIFLYADKLSPSS